jgi:hypothetical protein
VRSKKKRRKSPAQRGLGRDKAPVTTALLDAFTARDLEVWETRSIDLQSYHDRVYYDLERQRAARYEELCVALRAAPACEVSVDGWVRVTDWRWSLTPLSPAGSLKGIGGRLNIGGDLDRARGQAFPCLYIAQDIETALPGVLRWPTHIAFEQADLKRAGVETYDLVRHFLLAWPA